MAKSDGGSSSYYQKVIPAGVLKISGGPFDGQPLNTDVIMETDDVIKIFLKNRQLALVLSSTTSRPPEKIS